MKQDLFPLPNCSSRRFQLWLCLPSMPPAAIQAWAEWCSSPLALSLAYFVSSTLTQFMLALLHVGTRGAALWYVAVPHAVAHLCAAVGCARMWRHGPALDARPGALRISYCTCVLLIMLSVSVGPDDFVPYQNRPQAMLMVTATIMLLHLAAYSGGAPAFHPSVPYPSLREPVLASIKAMIQSMAACTDASVIRLVIVQVCSATMHLCISAAWAEPSHAHCM